MKDFLMPRRGATVIQANIARILRAYRGEGVNVRTRLLPDGSALFEPLEKTTEEALETLDEKEIVL
jgi:hypothetical protein